MNFERKYKLVLYKTYFDKGFGLTNNFKYLIGLFALYEIFNVNNLNVTLIIGLIWAIASFFIGWWWYRKDWNSAQIEVENNTNPFVKEVREKLLDRNI